MTPVPAGPKKQWNRSRDELWPFSDVAQNFPLGYYKYTPTFWFQKTRLVCTQWDRATSTDNYLYRKPEAGKKIKNGQERPEYLQFSHPKIEGLTFQRTRHFIKSSMWHPLMDSTIKLVSVNITRVPKPSNTSTSDELWKNADYLASLQNLWNQNL